MIPDLETLNSMLAACCGCGQLPECDESTEICESLIAYFNARGFYDPEAEEGEPPLLFKKQGWTGTGDYVFTTYNESSDPHFDGQVQRIETRNISTFFGQAYDILYEGGMGGLGDCPNYAPVVTDECTASATLIDERYDVQVWGESPDYHYDQGLSFKTVRELFAVGGEETAEHAAWVAIYTDEAGWEAAHAAWEIAHADWQSGYDAWVIAHADWEECEIETPGECGDEPTFDAPEPVEPPAEPGEFYPPCWFKVVETYTHYPHYWGYDESGGSAAPTTDNDEYQGWLDGGMTVETPCPGTGIAWVYYFHLSSITTYFPDISGATPYIETYNVTEPVTYAGLMATVMGVIAADLNFSHEGCISDDLCYAHLFKHAEEDFWTGAALVQAGIFRYKVGVPSSYMAHRFWVDGGSIGPEPQIFHYFSMQWDVCFFPWVWRAWQELYDAYRDSVEAHDQWVLDHAQWEIDHAQWEIDHANWETEHAAWEVEYAAWYEEYEDYEAAMTVWNDWSQCEWFTPGECGPEPPYPEYPGDPPPEPAEPMEPVEPVEPEILEDPGPQPDERPVFVNENLTWEWTGGETEESQYSDWYVVDAPTVPGENRIVNRQVVCWRSAMLGAPPTSYGEVYNPDDYPA